MDSAGRRAGESSSRSAERCGSDFRCREARESCEDATEVVREKGPLVVPSRAVTVGSMSARWYARTHPRGCFGCGCSWPATLGLTSAPLTAREALQHHYTRTGSSARTQARFRTQGSRASLAGNSVRLASSTISRLLVVMGCRARYSFPPALYCSGLCPIGCQQNTTRSKGWDSAARTSRRSPASGS